MSTNILSLNNVSKAYGADPLLDDVSVGVNAGEKVGIIGANGAGKSTLLKIIAGHETPDAGTLALRKATRIAYSEQVPNFSADATIGDVLELGISELKQTIAQYETAAAAMRDDAPALLDRIEQLGGWNYQHRIAQIAMEVGLDNLAARVQDLSGGERKRVALAQVMLSEPDLLLLDEPTNHLDAQTVEWLEQWLTSSRTTVILITHDRYFLDDVVDRMLELRDGSLRSYAGNYTDYLAARAVEEAQRERIHQSRLQTLMTELEWARRAPKARTTKSRARLDRIEMAQQEVANLARTPFVANFSFGKAPRLGSTILELDQVCVGYADQPPLINDLTLKMRAGERIGVLGPNGCGKTTLLRLITGELKPQRGKVKLGYNTQVAYFDQQRTDIDDALTLRQTLTPLGGDTVCPGGGTPVHVASWLDRFGFASPTHDRPVHTLSGGERNRLSIALFLLKSANVLIFDEPTNDLDIATLNILEEAIAGFDGCVMIVTHDRYLLDKLSTAVIAFERDYLGPGAVTCMEGNYTHYHDMRLKKLKAASIAQQKQREANERQVISAKQKKKQTAQQQTRQKKGLTYAERIELANIEPLIEQADAEVEALQAQLSDPSIWKDVAKAQALQAAIRAATEHAETLYARWEYLLER